MIDGLARAFGAVFAACVAVTAWAQPAPVLVDVGRAPLDVHEGRVGFRVEPFADGLARQQALTEVRVAAANGLADGTLTLEVGRAGSDLVTPQTHARSVPLARGTRKAMGLAYVPGRGGDTRTLSLGIGRHAAQVEFAITLLGEHDVGVAVIGNESLGVNAVADAWSGPVPGPRVREPATARKVRVGMVPIETMPSGRGPWSTVDWVVWPDPDPARVAPEAFDALRAWVADGGHLLVLFTDRWRAVAGSPLAPMLPARLEGMEDTETLGAMVRAVGGAPGAPTPAPIALATLDPDPARGAVTLAQVQRADGAPTPVWAAGHYGLGTVHVLLADPRVEPLSRDLSREDLWRRLLWLAPPDAHDDWLWRGAESWEDARWMTSANGWYLPDYGVDDGPHRRLLAGLGLAATSADDFYVAGASHYTLPGRWREGDPASEWERNVRTYLAEIPGVAPLPMMWLAVFAGLYLLMIGPVDYLVLRALNRPVWTWITFPVTIVVFSAIALIGTSRAKGNEAVTTRLEVVDVLPAPVGGGETLWRGTTYLGVWATRRSELVLTSGHPGGMATPMAEPGAMWSPVVITTDDGGALRWRAETWTLGYARTGWVAPRPGRVVLEARDEGGWRVRNALGVDLERAHLVADGRLLSLGPLADGATVDVQPTVPGDRALRDLAQAIEARGLEPPKVDDVLDPAWAERTLLEHPEAGRGHLSLLGSVALLGTTRAPFEPLHLSGLDPTTVSTTVFRVPLTLAGGAP